MTPDLSHLLSFLLHFGLVLLALPALWLATVSLAPDFTGRCRGAYTRPVVSTLVGMLVWLPFSVLGLAVHEEMRLLVAVLLVPSMLAVTGASGLALRLGAGLPRADDAEPAWNLVERGGKVLALALLMPVLGWFVLLPWVLISGTGAAVRTLVTRRKASLPPR